MNIDMERIQGLHSRLLDLSRRSTEVIANAQKQRHPFDNLNDAQRLFCGFLAHEAGQLVIAAATKLGLNQSLHADADIQAAAQSFFSAAGPFLGTHPELAETAYLNGAEILVDSAEALIHRAELVLNGEGSMKP